MPYDSINKKLLRGKSNTGSQACMRRKISASLGPLPKCWLAPVIVLVPPIKTKAEVIPHCSWKKEGGWGCLPCGHVPRMPGRNLAFCLLSVGPNPAKACAVPWVLVRRTCMIIITISGRSVTRRAGTARLRPHREMGTSPPGKELRKKALWDKSDQILPRLCHCGKAGAGAREGSMGGKWEAGGKDWTAAFGGNAGLGWLQCCVVQHLGSMLCGNLSQSDSWSQPFLSSTLSFFPSVQTEKMLIFCWGLWDVMCAQAEENQRSWISVGCCAADLIGLLSSLLLFDSSNS